MTICLAIECLDDETKKIPIVLIAADTQESSGFTKSSATKLRVIFGPEPKEKGKQTWEFVVASSGDSMIADEAIDEIFYFLGKKTSADDDPSVFLNVYRKELGDIAFTIYDKYNKRGVDDSHFSLLLAAAGEFQLILLVTCEGKTKQLERVGIIGSGKVTGGELLLSEFLKEEEMTECEALCLAALVISTVGHVDMFVSGKPDMYACRAREALEFADKYYREMLKKSELRWFLIKKVWQKMSEDPNLEKQLKGMMKG